MFSHLVLRIEQQYPVLRREYLPVSLLVVCPLLLLLGVILLDLKFRERVVVNGAETTFRPRLAVRCWWTFVALALVGNAVFSAGTKHIVGTGYVLALAHLLFLFELVRTFPSDVTIGSDGIRWRNLWAQVPCRGRTCTLSSRRNRSLDLTITRYPGSTPTRWSSIYS